MASQFGGVPNITNIRYGWTTIYCSVYPLQIHLVEAYWSSIPPDRGYQTDEAGRVVSIKATSVASVLQVSQSTCMSPCLKNVSSAARTISNTWRQIGCSGRIYPETQKVFRQNISPDTESILAEYIPRHRKSSGRIYPETQKVFWHDDSSDTESILARQILRHRKYSSQTNSETQQVFCQDNSRHRKYSGRIYPETQKVFYPNKS